jgi:uncharacterized membrane protein
VGAGHSHAHGHSHGGGLLDAVDGRLRRRLDVVAAVVGVLTVLGVVLLWPGDRGERDLGALGVADAYFDATVTRVEDFDCPGSEDTPDPSDDVFYEGVPSLCQNVTFRLEQGPDRGESRTVELFDVGPYPAIDIGDAVVVPYLADALPQFQYTQAFERERRLPMAVLAVAFAVLVVVQGRLRGLAALAGLTASIGVILVFVLPALVQGTPPVLVAIVAASLIAYLALYLAHGWNPLTTVALLGTLSSLVLVGLLSWAFTELTLLSGLSEEGQYIRAFGEDLDFSGLLLAGMILGALGALDDMTVTQASSVAELKLANPAYGARELYRSGIRIGRDHVASTVNTLALAYAGASLPLLLLFVESGRPFGRVLTSEVVAAEVVRTLVGSIGLVASVPLTTLLAARLVGGRRAGRTGASGASGASVDAGDGDRGDGDGDDGDAEGERGDGGPDLGPPPGDDVLRR